MTLSQLQRMQTGMQLLSDTNRLIMEINATNISSVGRPKVDKFFLAASALPFICVFSLSLFLRW